MRLRINSTIRNIKDIIKHKDILDIGATGMAQGTSMSNRIKDLAGTYTCIDKEEDVQKFDLGETFDVITMFEVLEHVDNPGLAIQQIKKHLKDDGILLLSVPNIKNIYHLLVQQTQWHLSCWDAKTLYQRLRKDFSTGKITKINYGRTLLAICKNC